jgi:Tfp pilus assembly protein PilX
MSSSATSCSGTRRGFILATTLLVTTLLTVMLAAAFILVSAEQRTTDNSFATARALALGQAGLETYFTQIRSLTDTSTYDSLRLPLANGYADVVARRVRRGNSAIGSPLALWVVQSTGVATSPVMTGQVAGRRTVAQFARQNILMLPARAAMVALNGASATAGGSSNPITGTDLGAIGSCVPPSGSLADTVALSVPTGGYFQDAGPSPTGRIEYFPSWSSLYDSTHIDWVALVSGGFDPDYTIPPASYPGFSNDYYVYYVPGNATVPSGQRRGLLVVSGNVTMANGAHWDGIILAGGNLVGQTGSSNWIIHGMAVTGLNMALGQAVGPNSLKRQNAVMQWTWCYTQSSVNSLGSLVPIANAWSDTWSTY